MNFFEHQEAAKKKTTALVGMMIAAIFSLILITTIAVSCVALYLETSTASSIERAKSGWIVDHYVQFTQTPTFWYIALSVVLVVVIGSIFKWYQLASGGRYVAEALGGRILTHDTQDADEKRVLNVVEEMAIASGNPVPPVYMMEDKSINAFAAGLSRNDAVVGITRGCATLLSRDELQGVMAHEFSHIHNGDMRLNLKLIAFIHGIVVIGLIGSILMRTSGRSRGGKNTGGLIFLGLALVIIGYSGTFFGNIIKSMISRQREYLADASAIQFTRNPDGISGALKKIGGYSRGARIESSGASEFSHMYFGQGISIGLNALMATHPPLPDRIRRIEPQWDGKFITPEEKSSHIDSEGKSDGKTKKDKTSVSDAIIGATVIAGVTAAAGASTQGAQQQSDNELVDSVGEITKESIELTRTQIESLPAEILQAAHNPYSARALVYCLFLNEDRDARLRQIEIISDIAHPNTFQEMRRLYSFVKHLERSNYLVLMDICLPALKQLSKNQRNTFRENMRQLMQEDNSMSLYEWCLYRIVTHNIERIQVTEKRKLSDCKHSIETILSATAMMTAENHRDDAFNSALEIIPIPNLTRIKAKSIDELEIAIDELSELKPMEKPKLLKAVMAIIKYDRKATPSEAELFRAIADILDCPVPPFYPAKYLT